MVVMIERRLAINPTTTITHWQCEVRLNEMMNGKIFLHWPASEELEGTSRISVQWFLRVLLSMLIELDIPQLSLDGIYFGGDCFLYTYSLQSSSTYSFISSSFDAYDLQMYIMSKSYNTAFNLAMLQENLTDLVIPNDYFNGNGISSFILSDNGNLRRIEVGNNTFGKVRVFELNGLRELESVVIGQKSFTYAKTDSDIWNSRRTDGSYSILNCPKLQSIHIGNYSFSDYHSIELSNLPSLESIEMDRYNFYWAPSFSLIGMFDWLNWIYRSS